MMMVGRMVDLSLRPEITLPMLLSEQLGDIYGYIGLLTLYLFISPSTVDDVVKETGRFSGF